MGRAHTAIKKGAIRSWLAATALLLLALPAQALQLVDDRGVSVELAAAPQRIVSLLPSLTETVCELGQCHRLVGVDRYSNYPAPVRALPQMGGGLDPSLEAVSALSRLCLMAVSARGAPRWARVKAWRWNPSAAPTCNA